MKGHYSFKVGGVAGAPDTNTITYTVLKLTSKFDRIFLKQNVRIISRYGKRLHIQVNSKTTEIIKRAPAG